MSYIVKIKDMDTGEEERKLVNTNKEFKSFLLEYRGKTIEVEFKSIKENTRVKKLNKTK